LGTADTTSRQITLAADPAMLANQPFNEVARIVADAGYSALELSPRSDFLPGYEEPKTSPSLVRSVATAAAASRVEIASLMVVYDWASPNEEVRHAATRYWREAISVATDLGCSRLNTEFTGDPNRPRESEAAFLRSVEELLPAIEEADLRVFVEPHPFDFVETGAGAVRVLAGLGSGRFGYIFCAPHTFYLAGSIAEQVGQAGRLLGHVHLADTFAPARIIVNPPGTDVRTHQHLDIGQGEIDWPAVFAALASVEFGGMMTVSVFAWPERASESLRSNGRLVRDLACAAGLGLEAAR
jgi:myo-inositol catabolism protein IolH